MTEGKCGEGRDLGREMEVHEGKDGWSVARRSGLGHNLVWGSGRQREGMPVAASKAWSRASRQGEEVVWVLPALGQAVGGRAP